MAIARSPAFVIDCPDPGQLARFYGALLDWEVSVDEDDGWAEVRPADGSSCISFQQVADYRAPQWPDQEVPQQVHLDVIVDDLDEGGAAVVGLAPPRPRGSRAPPSGCSSTRPATRSACASSEAGAVTSTTVRRRLPAPPPVVYAALLDAGAVQRWKVPSAMTSQLHESDAREGGRVRVSLTYVDPDRAGKSSAHSDTYTGCDLPPGVDPAPNEQGWQEALDRLADLLRTP